MKIAGADWLANYQRVTRAFLDKTADEAATLAELARLGVRGREATQLLKELAEFEE